MTKPSQKKGQNCIPFLESTFKKSIRVSEQPAPHAPCPRWARGFQPTRQNGARTPSPRWAGRNSGRVTERRECRSGARAALAHGCFSLHFRACRFQQKVYNYDPYFDWTSSFSPNINQKLYLVDV